MRDRTYFLARANLSPPDTCHIKGPFNADGSYSEDTWAFSTGTVIKELSSLPRFALDKPGRRPDFAFTPYGAVLVNSKVCAILEHCGFDVQLVPCQIEDETSNSIFNPVHCLDCIDRDLSTAEYNRDGSVKMMLDLKFSPAPIEHDIFRIKNWETAGFVISEQVFQVLEKQQLSGLEFIKV